MAFSRTTAAQLNFQNLNGQPVGQRQQPQLNQQREQAPAPVAYLNVYLPLAGGERARLGDKGIPLRAEKPAELALLNALQNGQVTPEQLMQVLIVEIGQPRDPNQPLEIDFSALTA